MSSLLHSNDLNIEKHAAHAAMLSELERGQDKRIDMASATGANIEAASDAPADAASAPHVATPEVSGAKPDSMANSATDLAPLYNSRFTKFALIALFTLAFAAVYVVAKIADNHIAASQQATFLTWAEWTGSLTLVSLLVGLSWLLSRFIALQRVASALQTQQVSLAAQHTALAEAQQIAKCGSWATDARGNIISVSDEWLAIFNLTQATRPKTANEWIDRFVAPEDAESVKQNWSKILRDAPVESVREIRLADGSRKWIQTITFPVKQPFTSTERYRGIARDITAEKNAEILLADRTTQLSDAKRIGRLGSWFWDSSSDSLNVCERVCEIYEVTTDSCPATLSEWTRRFERADTISDARRNPRDEHQNAVGDSAIHRNESSSVGNSYIEGVRHIVTASGMSKWVQWIGSPSVNKEGRLIGYHGITRDLTAETLAERRLAQSEQRYRLISERMHDVVTLHALDSAIIYVSPSVQKMLGYLPERSIGNRSFDLVHPEDKARVAAQISDVCKNGLESAVLECRYRHLDGHYCWIESVITPVVDHDGAIANFQSATRNIDRRKCAEAALKTSERRFRSLTELSSDWYWEMDAQYRFTFMSQESHLNNCASRSQLLGKTAWEAFPLGLTPTEWEVHRADLDARRPFYNLVTTSRDPISGEIKMYCSLSAEPIFSALGEFKGYWGTGNDITERKRAEQALRLSELRFRSLTELSSDWYWEQDDHYRFTFVSSISPDMAALSSDRVMGKTRWELFPNAFTEAGWAAHRADLEARRPYRNLVGRIVDPVTGELRGYSSLSGEPIFNEFGDFKGYWGTGNDITNRKQAEEALAMRTRELALINSCLEEEVKRRQDLERNFLMSIEHELAQVGLELHDDLGQDLTGIALLTKTLERKLREHGLAETAEAARISDLVNRTIKHTRLISHGLSPYMWGSDGLISALRQLASDVESLGVVHCEALLDPIQIHDEVVARNLYRIAQEAVNNALKHGGANEIIISLRQSKAGVHLTISDNGMVKNNIESIESNIDAQQNQLKNSKNDYDKKFYSIRHRASAIDAAITINAVRNKGFEVSVWWSPNLNQRSHQLTQATPLLAPQPGPQQTKETV